MDIDQVRKEIDELDKQLLDIFNRRANLALKIGEIKKTKSIPVYDPAREQRIFDKMQQNNPGPLANEAIVRLFKTVIHESRSLESEKTEQL